MPAMADEIEMKVRVDDFAAVRRALKRCGARHLGTVVQSDVFFDTDERALLADSSGLRVRRTRIVRPGCGARPDARPLLTFKGPVRPGRKAKIRREMETRFETPGALADILGALGLKIILSYEKRRCSYRLGRCGVELDEVPLLGRFVEVEGPNERTVVGLTRKLGLGGESIKTGYARLLAEACERLGRKPIHIKLRAGRKRR